MRVGRTRKDQDRNEITPHPEGISNEQVAAMTQEEWRMAVGPTLGAETRPGHIKRGCLHVYATSNLVLQELHFSKIPILQRLQAALPDFKIRDLRFHVG